MRASVLLTASLCLAAEAQASPWNRDRGQGLTINRYGYYAAEADGRRFEQHSSDFYGEIGLTRRLMAGAKLSYVWQGVESERGADALSGFSEGTLFVQAEALRWEGGALSVMTSAAMPTETVSRLDTGRAFGRDAHGGVGVLLGLSEKPGFLAARIGHEASFGEDADFLRSEMTIGANLPGDTLAMVEAFDTRSLGGASLTGLDYDLTQIAPSLVFRLSDRFRLQLGATLDVSGRNVDQGAGGFVALWVGE